jgi:hypothetical protein
LGPDTLPGVRVPAMLRQLAAPDHLAGVLYECWRRPKVELHLHLEGSLRVASVCEMAGRHDPRSPLIRPDWHVGYWTFRDLPGFVQQLRGVHRACVRDLADLERLAREAFEDLALQNVRYAEVSWSARLPNHPFYLPLGKAVSTIDRARREVEQRELGGHRALEGDRVVRAHGHRDASGQQPADRMRRQRRDRAGQHVAGEADVQRRAGLDDLLHHRFILDRAHAVPDAVDRQPLDGVGNGPGAGAFAGVGAQPQAARTSESEGVHERLDARARLLVAVQVDADEVDAVVAGAERLIHQRPGAVMGIVLAAKAGCPVDAQDQPDAQISPALDLAARPVDGA